MHIELYSFTPNVSTNAKDWCDTVTKTENAIKERLVLPIVLCIYEKSFGVCLFDNF
jgi:hypothetical protein